MEQVSKRLMNWASILEEGTREQAIRSSQMPFIYPHLALMPDAHWGMGATVGSVIPTKGAIMPAAVGVDIGCGMVAIKTDATIEDLHGLDADDLRRDIEQRIPLSPGHYNTGLYNEHTDERLTHLESIASGSLRFNPDEYAGNWRMQLGSLGGGNHFIEVCYDEEEFVWLFLHSGSRGVGNKIATKHIRVAQALMKRWYIDLPDPNLAYLVEGTDEFWSYIRELTWAQRFAYFNREEMMERVRDAFDTWVGHRFGDQQTINCHHNYTVQERHFGQSVWLSRKGAIDASEGTWGLIPGSMGAASYVVQGKGNHLALNSSPHGAGRNFSRRKAREQFTHADLQERMKGISWRDSEAFLDEHPDAYKDIDVVMADSADLVEIRHTLRQFVNVKGT